jgi:DNA-binding MarR family transcriptional regulator
VTAPNPLFLREEELDRGLDLLLLAGRQLAAEAKAALDEAGLDETDHRLLFAVQRRPGIALVELCRAMGMTKQTLSRHLRRLAALGLVDQGGGAGGTDAADRRRRPLTATPAAGELLARANAAQKRRLRLAFKDAGAASVEGFQRVLQALVVEPRRAAAPPPRAARVA